MLGDIKITILTATFNSGKTLEQAISSVVNQDYKNIEYIIIDGASTDNTIEIIKKYEKYGIKWISEPDNGLYDAFNKGIDMATGDYFQVLGSDDCLYSNSTISKVVSKIEKETDILSAPVVVVDEVSKKEMIAYNHHAIDKNIYNGRMIPHQGMFVKTEITKKIKFDTSYIIAADYKFFLQCYYNDEIKFKYINDPVAYYSNGGVSSNDDLCELEYTRIYHELGLEKFDVSTTKKSIKVMLKNIRLFGIAKKIKQELQSVFVFKKHHCDNKICRWCDRL